MQGLASFVIHFVAKLLLVGHIVLAAILPHPHVVVASIATSTPAQIVHIFPAVRNKPAQDFSTVASHSEAALASASSTSAASQLTMPALPPPLSQGTVNDMARGALVNILCTTKNGGYLYPISGSGVLISDKGVVLTNAHVGQYFLLRDYLVPDNVDCVVRTGSPATPEYHAELLYLPPVWIDANASQITAQEGTGTGQDDYSLLLITSPIAASGPPLPASFPSLAITLDDPTEQEPVLLASYPAGYLEGITIEMDLYITSALSNINQIFAFDSKGYADVISVGTTVVSQAGSSGGAIVRMQDGALQGIIATATAGSNTSSRELRGITLSHIDRSLASEGMGGIVQLVSGDLTQKANDFNTNVAPGEEQKLIDALNK